MATRAQTIGRWVLAGPITLIAAILAMAATPVWLPAGESGVDNIVMPIVLFPAYWAVFFVVAIIAKNVWRTLAAILGISAVHGFLIYGAFTA
ncbi:MAG: hypothetical protein AAGH76_07650 [Pseudomonadota bacterium]